MLTGYYTTSEAAEALNVSEITIKRYIYAGKLQSTKLPGGQHRIPRAEVERLLAGQGTRTGATEAAEGDLGERVVELETALEHVIAELQVLAAWCERHGQAEVTHEAAEEPLHRIEVLGPGCRRCDELFELVRAVVRVELGESATVEQVNDLGRITEYGPVLTPAIAVDRRLVPLGRTPSRARLAKLLKSELQ
jgi:small redox-active disulfide protein 2